MFIHGPYVKLPECRLRTEVANFSDANIRIPSYFQYPNGYIKQYIYPNGISSYHILYLTQTVGFKYRHGKSPTLWWTFTVCYGKIHHFLAGKIHYFDWAIFHSFLYVHQRVFSSMIFAWNLHWLRGFPSHVWFPRGKTGQWRPNRLGF